jgi:hypothetical protein
MITVGTNQDRRQCVGEKVFYLHEPQHAAHDSSFSYDKWCAKFYLRHTAEVTLMQPYLTAVLGRTFTQCRGFVDTQTLTL